MSVTARAAPNIALIKYWGNRNNDWRLPMADSLSVTLDRPTVEITIDHAKAMTLQSFDATGKEKMLKPKDIQRFATHLALTKEYLAKLGIAEALPDAASIIIHSAIPSSIGLASSAAVFGCIAKAYAGLISGARMLTDKEISVIARLGSGSAARSIFGGFVALREGENDAIDASFAEQIAPASHWNLHDIVIVPSHDEKKVGSTEGHAGAHTSPMYAARIHDIRSRREQACIDAVLAKDFKKLMEVSEEDCWDMHEVIGTQKPPIEYVNNETHRIVQGVIDMREADGTEALYTMDAGPTVHVLCTDNAHDKILAYAKEQEKKGCTVYETKIGGPAVLL